MSIGYRTKELRKAKGWSQTELGEKIGMTAGGLSNLEKDKCDASQAIIIKLSEIFEVSTDYLLKGIETERTISESEQEILEVLRKDEAMTNAVMEFAKVKKKAISFTRSYAAANQNSVMG